MPRTRGVLDNNHATNRKASNHAIAGRDLILSLRRHQDHATRCGVRRVVIPGARHANPEAAVGSQKAEKLGVAIPGGEKPGCNSVARSSKRDPPCSSTKSSVYFTCISTPLSRNASAP